MPLTRDGQQACQPLIAATHILLRQLWRPVRRHIQPQQFFGRKSHHIAKGGVHIGDAALQITRPHACDQRVFHGFAKRQRIAQIALGAQTAAVVAHQHHHHRNQRNRHGRDQRRHHIGEHAGRVMPAVHAQHQRVAGQVQQLLGRKHARATPCRAHHGQTGAIRLGK